MKVKSEPNTHVAEHSLHLMLATLGVMQDKCQKMMAYFVPFL
jgi:hypothetical protein